MNKFLEMYLQKLSQEERENMKRLITSNVIEIIIKELPKNKSPRQDGFTGEFDEAFKEELIAILVTVFQKI